MNGSVNDYILFKSVYGSGKTILMRTRCEQEAEKNFASGDGKKCLFVVGGMKASNKFMLLQMALSIQWQHKPYGKNIELQSVYDLMVSKQTDNI